MPSYHLYVEGPGSRPGELYGYDDDLEDLYRVLTTDGQSSSLSLWTRLPLAAFFEHTVRRGISYMFLVFSVARNLFLCASSTVGL